ncbi:MAG: ribosome biogenesis GTP-binding protein YihA/YsxC [Bacteroidia bacterium]
MKITSAEFLISNTNIDKCPPPIMPEYAFIGRSNVGKSSLINMLTDRVSLAKTSVKPGKTQLINHFLINKNWYLVDLPGYGYAEVPKVLREQWEKFIRHYLLKRTNLMCVFVLIDIRHEAQKVDTEFMKWLGENEIPFVIVFTKKDKLSKTVFAANSERYKQAILKYWEELPTLFFTSATTKTGQIELLDFIENTNKLFVKK